MEAAWFAIVSGMLAVYAVLDGFDAYAIYSQADGATGTGDLLLFGTSCERRSARSV